MGFLAEYHFHRYSHLSQDQNHGPSGQCTPGWCRAEGNLIYLIYALGIFCLHTIVTLWFYIAIMRWKAEGMTSRNASYYQKFIFALGIITDFGYNYSPLGGSLALLQFPRKREILFTSHLKRVMKARLTKTRMQRYRLVAAEVYCAILDWFDAGHCR